MEDEGKSGVTISKIGDGWVVRVERLTKIELVSALGAMQESIRKHAGEDNWRAMIGALLMQVYRNCGESSYQQLLEKVAETIKEKL